MKKLMLFSDILVGERFEMNGELWIKLSSNAAGVPGEGSRVPFVFVNGIKLSSNAAGVPGEGSRVPFVFVNEDYAVIAPDREPDKPINRYDIALGRHNGTG